MGSPISPIQSIELSTDKITFFRHFDENYLRDQYVVLGKSMNQIAKDMSCSRSSVRGALERLNFQIKSSTEQNCSRGQLAYGEQLVGGKIVPHKAEQKVIQKILELREAGATYDAVAVWLNDQGVPTKNGAKSWQRPTVFKIIKQRTAAISHRRV